MISNNLAVSTDIDLDRDGTFHSTVWMSYSSNTSAYGRIGIPITSIRHGAGPGVLFLAGTHGDEYEGQIALRRLALNMDHNSIRGSILILPSLNWPAVANGSRLSPLDNGNLFRSYSDQGDLKPTASIANFVKSKLVGRVRAIIDIHSGGTSLSYLPSSQMFLGGDTVRDQASLDLLNAFNAPYGLISMGVKPHPTSLFGVAYSSNIPFLTTELGGAFCDAEGVEIAYEGALNVLRFLDILEGPKTESRTRMLQISKTEQVVYCMQSGILERRVRLGELVSKGQLVGLLHPLNSRIEMPVQILAPTEGTVVCERPLPLCKSGDCLFVFGT
jgi:uncharacterized protein